MEIIYVNKKLIKTVHGTARLNRSLKSIVIRFNFSTLKHVRLQLLGFRSCRSVWGQWILTRSAKYTKHWTVSYPCFLSSLASAIVLRVRRLCSFLEKWLTCRIVFTAWLDGSVPAVGNNNTIYCRHILVKIWTIIYDIIISNHT